MKEKSCRLRGIAGLRLFAACLVTLIAISVTTVAAQQLYWPAHTPLIDGDDILGDNSLYQCPQSGQASTLYKCQYKGYLYGHYNEGSNTPLTTAQTQHDSDGQTFGKAIHAMCPTGGCVGQQTPKIVVLMIGFSNWTKEARGNQPPLPSRQIGDINHPADLNCSLDDHVPPCSAAWSFIH